MSTPLATSLHLGSEFATELPELAIPWQAEDAPEPQLVVLNDQLALDLGLDPEWLRSPGGIAALLGQGLPVGASPVAQAYAGHQFGMFVPRLGDGRALLLGELTAPDGSIRDIHLKGSGSTPFARGADGRAAVGPMLREFLLSEALHALGLPTTRSLAVVATGRTVFRDDGDHPGAVLVRVATSHLRVGTFEYARGLTDPDALRRLADHAIHRHYPEAAASERPYRDLLASVVRTQAELVAGWLLVGFVHGVMNTDNMAVSGETIDYGPCAFLDGFDPAAVFSSIDAGGRYAFGRQPAIAQWNLGRFAEAILPLVDEDPNRAVESAQEVLAEFPRHFGRAWTAGMRRKLGLPREVGDDVVGPLADELLGLLAAGRTDYTSFFRRLGPVARGTPQGTTPAIHPGADVRQDGGGLGFERNVDGGQGTSVSALTTLVADASALSDWLDRWRALGPDPDAMDRSNPIYLPRNHLADEALNAAEAGDLGPFERLLDAVRDPYRERPGLERYAAPAPEGYGPFVTYCGT